MEEKRRDLPEQGGSLKKVEPKRLQLYGRGDRQKMTTEGMRL